jgi:recombination protein RecA
MLGDGFPKGRSVVFVGEPGTGKTLLAQLVIAAAQREGGRAMFFDAEKTYDPRWFAKTGVDIDPKKLIIVRPRNLEQAFDMIEDALERIKPALIVVDSLPALVPKKVVEEKLEEKENIALFARKIGPAIQKATLANTVTCVIYINQIRTAIGRWGDPSDMPGGYAFKHANSQLIRTRRGAWILENEDKSDMIFGDDKEKKKVGFILKLRVERNKVAEPWKEAEVEFRWKDGSIDWISSLVHEAMTKGIIESPSKGYFTSVLWEGKIHGREKLENTIRNDVVLKASLIECIKG